MKFDQNMPIYIQIMDDFKQKIVSGEYEKGSRVDTVRNLAIIYGVNPNTVQRALSELERDGLVYSERTNGRFITEDAPMIASVRQNIAEEKVEVFVDDMHQIGFNDVEIVESVKGSLKNGN